MQFLGDLSIYVMLGQALFCFKAFNFFLLFLPPGQAQVENGSQCASEVL